MWRKKKKVATEVDENARLTLEFVRERFGDFLALLRTNTEVLHIMSDMEEKSHGEYLFDINYVRSSLKQLRSRLREIVDRLVSLGGEQYQSLQHRFTEIDVEIEGALPGKLPIQPDDYTITLEKVGRERALSVGSKNAQLGEMKSTLGLPVPEGFAISAWAYKSFIDANDLQQRINRRIASLDVKCYADLLEVSEEIQRMITEAPIPGDLAEAIQNSFAELAARSGAERFALRSSAIGEDSLYSFAGQYATFLNVSATQLLDSYRQVLASKFTPQAIYYFLSHSLAESELAMSVGCLVMVNAKAAGVVYSRDPVSAREDTVLVHSIWGLGKYLVEGTLTPDSFRLSRLNGRLIERRIAFKPRRLVMHGPDELRVEPVPADEQREPSISDEHLRLLVDYAVKLEDHYGSPQDIEWAVDCDNRLCLLQTRPLRMVNPEREAETVDTSQLTVLANGGRTVCPGAASGPVIHVTSTLDLCNIPDGAVLIAPNSFAGLITTMRQANAIITVTGGVASHMATIAREYRVPAIAGLKAAAHLGNGQVVTVDASQGVVYDGVCTEVIEARRNRDLLYKDLPIYDLLRQILTRIAPLKLLNPGDENFSPEKCTTFHDIIRYAHQMGIEEMLKVAEGLSEQDNISLRLKTDIPLELNVVLLDESHAEFFGQREIAEDDIASIPMQAFWGGVRLEGWPSARADASADVPGATLKVNSPRRKKQEFNIVSFAIISREYMILSLHLGYHFTTVEAMCTGDSNNNFIRMQYKEGGASRDRRIRRVKLISTILERLGFEKQSEGDFLNSSVTNMEPEQIRENLHLLGRITMLTKQLDMALSNDAVTKWYTNDILRQLGLISDNRPTD